MTFPVCQLSFLSVHPPCFSQSIYATAQQMRYWSVNEQISLQHTEIVRLLVGSIDNAVTQRAISYNIT
jgi:hypothetical protein